MALSVSFDSARFSRSFARAQERKANVAEKWVRYECPSCARVCRATLSEIAKQSVRPCGGCGKGVRMVDEGGGFARNLAHG